MGDLIAALQIFARYSDLRYPTLCRLDELRVLIDPKVVSDRDKKRLKELSFVESEENFVSFRFGTP